MRLYNLYLRLKSQTVLPICQCASSLIIVITFNRVKTTLFPFMGHTVEPAIIGDVEGIEYYIFYLRIPSLCFKKTNRRQRYENLSLK